MQRRLLEQLAGLASAQAPVAVAGAALACMRVVMGVLGEVPLELLPRLREPVNAQLASSHACLRSQVVPWHPACHALPVTRLLLSHMLLLLLLLLMSCTCV